MERTWIIPKPFPAPTPGLWKKCLPGNQFVVPKRLGTTGLKKSQTTKTSIFLIKNKLRISRSLWTCLKSCLFYICRPISGLWGNGGTKGLSSSIQLLPLLPEHLWAVPRGQEASQRSMKSAPVSTSSSYHPHPPTPPIKTSNSQWLEELHTCLGPLRQLHVGSLLRTHSELPDI